MRRSGVSTASPTLSKLPARNPARLRDGGQTQTVTLSQLDDAVAAVALAVRQARLSDDDLAAQLVGLQAEAEIMVDIAGALAIERGDGSGADMLFWAQATVKTIVAHRHDLAQSASAARSATARLSMLEDTARSMALAMDFGFLFNRRRQLLSIGFLAPEGALDTNCYDLLASEARLASFFAIAKGDVAAKHWFRLGRAATPVAHGAALISWSGSMFEYLMPSLVMRAPAGSLLEQTNRLVVRRQIAYAAKLGLPWGISESAYNARDLEFTYQYSNFGVPGLGLKRGLGENRVIAPYATALAAMVDPRAAAANLARLAEVGALGRYGFYDALDYTPARVPEGESVAIVRAFMAHHQGMTIVAIADALFKGVMRRRFHAEPIVKASELLLQERMPRDVAATRPWAAEVKSAASARDVEPSGGRRFLSAHQATPATHLLSNGRYATMLTSAGSGYSRWGDLALTRWREDATCDDFGSYLFIKDVRSGVAWSAGFQPSGVEPDAYAVAFNEDRVEVTRRDGSLTTTLDVLVSGEDDAEVRRVSITNSGGGTRDIEITSYAELVLAPQSADVAHPAFSKLFVETEYLADTGAILATRRRRAPTDPEIWAAHLSVVDGEAVGAPEFETDRARFLGRGRGVRTPIAVTDSRPLSNSTGAVLDPIFSIRRRIRVAPGATVRVAFWTIAASSRAALLDGVDKHRDATAFARASMLAWTQAQVQLHHLGVTAGEAGLFQRLAGHVIYAAPALRPSSDAIVRGGGAQSGLWPQGISGDLPIVLLRIADVEHLDIVRELLQAHEYWRMKQLAVDLVILNERRSSYVQELQVAIETMVRASQSRPQPGAERPAGRVFVLRADLIAAETRALLTSAARVVLPAQRGGLFEQLERILEPVESVESRAEARRRAFGAAVAASPARPRILQRTWRVHARRRRVCDDPRAGPIDARAVDQRHRQSDVRVPDGNRGRRLHLVRQQSRESDHAMVERPRRRPKRRSLLLARRRHRRLVGPDGASHPRRGGDIHGPPRSRLQPVRACRARDRVRSCAIRAGRRFDQDFAPRADQSVEPPAPAQRDGLCRMGSRLVAFGLAAVHFHRTRRRHGGDLRPQSLEHGLRIARRFRRFARRSERLDRRSARVHRAQRRACRSRRARRRGAAVEEGRRRSRPLRGDAHEDRTAALRQRRSRLLAWRSGERRRGAQL